VVVVAAATDASCPWRGALEGGPAAAAAAGCAQSTTEAIRNSVRRITRGYGTAIALDEAAVSG
jgi:hypothetical protein